MKTFLSYIDGISEWTGKIVSYVCPIVVVITTWEIVMRYAFKAPTYWAHESTIYLCTALYLLAGAYVHRHYGHINMDIVYGRFSPRIRAVIDLFTFPIFLLFCGTLLLIGSKFFWDSFETKEVANTFWGPPLYPIKLLIPLGGFLIFLQGLANVFRVFFLAVKGKEMP